MATLFVEKTEMGEGKRRHTLTQRLLAAQPFCIYCGGETKATTADHLPPIRMFERRQRPKGLEFSSCPDCNHGSSRDEQVAALLARIYPDPRNDELYREVQRMMKEVKNNHPGLLEEMLAEQPQWETFLSHSALLPPDVGPLKIGPLLDGAINRFAAKFCCAMHYKATGRIVPATGVIASEWHTNFQARIGDIPVNLLKALGPMETLRQGTKEVSNQFEYSHVASTSGARSAHYARFGESFAVFGVVFEEADELALPEDTRASRYQPGWLKQIKRDKE
jgi:hypothetical protein